VALLFYGAKGEIIFNINEIVTSEKYNIMIMGRWRLKEII